MSRFLSPRRRDDGAEALEYFGDRTNGVPKVRRPPGVCRSWMVADTTKEIPKTLMISALCGECVLTFAFNDL